MTRYNYEELMEKDNHRLELDNLPEDCMYCGYRMRPSSSMDSCSEYCKKGFKKDTKK